MTSVSIDVRAIQGLQPTILEYRNHLHYRPPQKRRSTEKTSEKETSKKENDTSSDGNNISKGKWYATDETDVTFGDMGKTIQ